MESESKNIEQLYLISLYDCIRSDLESRWGARVSCEAVRDTDLVGHSLFPCVSMQRQERLGSSTAANWKTDLWCFSVAAPGTGTQDTEFQEFRARKQHQQQGFLRPLLVARPLLPHMLFKRVSEARLCLPLHGRRCRDLHPSAISLALYYVHNIASHKSRQPELKLIKEFVLLRLHEN